jgi:hypothetical protein
VIKRGITRSALRCSRGAGGPSLSRRPGCGRRTRRDHLRRADDQLPGRPVVDNTDAADARAVGPASWRSGPCRRPGQSAGRCEGRAAAAAVGARSGHHPSGHGVPDERWRGGVAVPAGARSGWGAGVGVAQVPLPQQSCPSEPPTGQPWVDQCQRRGGVRLPDRPLARGRDARLSS